MCPTSCQQGATERTEGRNREGDEYTEKWRQQDRGLEQEEREGWKEQRPRKYRKWKKENDGEREKYLKNEKEKERGSIQRPKEKIRKRRKEREGKICKRQKEERKVRRKQKTGDKREEGKTCNADITNHKPRNRTFITACQWNLSLASWIIPISSYPAPPSWTLTL